MTRGLGSLCDKNQEFRDEEVCEEALKFKFAMCYKRVKIG